MTYTNDHALNLAVAAHAMGWDKCPNCGAPIAGHGNPHGVICERHSYGCTWNFNPATDANHSVELLEKVGIPNGVLGKYVTLNGWYVDWSGGRTEAPTFCLAVCLATLRSVGHECEYKPEETD